VVDTSVSAATAVMNKMVVLRNTFTFSLSDCMVDTSLSRDISTL
jgi:hypothetical protein